MALTIEDIFNYSKDKPELNILLEGELQSGAPLIELAIKLTISDFNSTPPVTDFYREDFPNDSILLYGVLHHLCNSEAERQLRNQINFNAQGVQAGIDDKFQQYLTFAQYYKQLFDSKVKEYKMYLNTEQAWGDLSSPYAAINPRQFRS